MRPVQNAVVGTHHNHGPSFHAIVATLTRRYCSGVQWPTPPLWSSVQPATKESVRVVGRVKIFLAHHKGVLQRLGHGHGLALLAFADSCRHLIAETGNRHRPFELCTLTGTNEPGCKKGMVRPLQCCGRRQSKTA